MNLNILILHKLGDPLKWRKSLADHELCLPIFEPNNNYVIHDFSLPFPKYLENVFFDAIIVNQTFLGSRNDRNNKTLLEKNYSSILNKPFYKLFFTQDEYQGCQILDDWAMKFKIDNLYTVCFNEKKILFPRFSINGKISKGYTGYISENLILKSKKYKQIQNRDVDVAYRAAGINAMVGKMGVIKTEYGNRFINKALNFKLKIDVSTNEKDTIFGEKWYDFVNNTRCMLGVNSGSSLLDPDSSIRDRVVQYQIMHPKSSFEEIEAACFPGLDERYIFTAISPRNFECALFGTAQILVPGEYSGFLKPWENYLPLEADMSNFDEIWKHIKKVDYLQKMADLTKEKILSFPELLYSNHLKNIILEIKNNTTVTDSQREKSITLIKRYQKNSKFIENNFWKKERKKLKTRKLIGDFGLRRNKKILKNLNNIK